MFKFRTIGAYNRQVNIPDTVAEVDMLNGYGVNIDTATRKATPHATGKKPYVVMNLMDQPEIRNSDDFKVRAGECLRLFDLDALVGLDIEFDKNPTSETISALQAGDALGFVNGTGVIAKAGDTSVAHFVVAKVDTEYGGRVIATVVPGAAAPAGQ